MVLLLLSLDHGSNTITMGACRPTGCAAVSYQSTQPTLALRRQIMDEFSGLILFCRYQSVVHLQRSPSLSLRPPTPTSTPHTHTDSSHFPLLLLASFLPSVRPPAARSVRLRCPVPHLDQLADWKLLLRSVEGVERGEGFALSIKSPRPHPPLSGPLSPHCSVP